MKWSFLVVFCFFFSIAYSQTDSLEVVKDTIVAEARISFQEKVHNFKEVKQGKQVTYTFEFTNTGRTPFQILTVQSACDCAVVAWDKKTFKEGEKGKIKVTFDTKGKQGKQTKNILVITTAQNKETLLQITGEVLL